MSLLAAVAGSLAYVRVQLSNLTPSDVASPGPAEASFSLESDGDIVSYTSTVGTVDEGDWVTPKSAAGANFEVRATLNSGTLTSGTTGSWLALSSTRSWNVVQIGSGSSTAQILVEIRRASTGTVLASCTVDLTAEVL